jgi:drug/metabolite transporter (DMT)-like permease
MSVQVMLVVLAAAALHATWNAMIKAGTDQVLNTVLIATGAGLLAGLTLPFRPLPEPACWPFLLASVVIHLAYFSWMALAYRYGDLSYAYPLMRGTAPLLTVAVAAWIVPEPLSWSASVGIVLLSLGILLLAREALRSGMPHRRTTLFALANAVVISTYTIVDGLGVRQAGDTASYVSWLLFLSALALLSFRLTTHPAAVLGGYLRTYWQQGVMGGLCTILAYGLSLWAMTRAPVALVAALRETSVIFAILIGAVLLQERFGRARYVATFMVTAGAAAMRIL